MIGHTEKELSVVRIFAEGDLASIGNNFDLELSYETRLFHECHDSNAQKTFLEQMKEHSLPAEPVTLSYQPQVQASAYITLVQALGLDGCLHLLKRVHQDAMIIHDGHATLSAPVGSTTRYIADTILISCLPVVDLIHTSKLVIQYCSLQVLAHTAMKIKVMYIQATCRNKVYVVKTNVVALMFFTLNILSEINTLLSNVCVCYCLF